MSLRLCAFAPTLPKIALYTEVSMPLRFGTIGLLIASLCVGTAEACSPPRPKVIAEVDYTTGLSPELRERLAAARGKIVDDRSAVWVVPYVVQQARRTEQDAAMRLVANTARYLIAIGIPVADVVSLPPVLCEGATCPPPGVAVVVVPRYDNPPPAPHEGIKAACG